MTEPFALSTHQRYRLSSASATLRKMRLPQMIGVAPLLLGMAIFQTTPSVLFQCKGRSFSSLTPLREGPRHWGQFSAVSAKDNTKNQNPRRYRIQPPGTRESRQEYHSKTTPARPRDSRPIVARRTVRRSPG